MSQKANSYQLKLEFDRFNSEIYNLRWHNIILQEGEGITDSTAITNFCKDSDIISIKINSNDVKSINLLEDNGFKFICINVFFKISINREFTISKSVDFAVKDDVPYLREIASNIFVYDRFHSAYFLPVNKSNELHGKWIENEFSNKKIIVYRDKGKPVGFLSFLENKIYLLGVKKEYRRMGIANTLITSFLGILSGEGKKECFVDTQITNPVILLYQKIGFVMTGHTLILYWYKKGGLL